MDRFSHCKKPAPIPAVFFTQHYFISPSLAETHRRSTMNASHPNPPPLYTEGAKPILHGKNQPENISIAGATVLEGSFYLQDHWRFLRSDPSTSRRGWHSSHSWCAVSCQEESTASKFVIRITTIRQYSVKGRGSCANSALLDESPRSNPCAAWKIALQDARNPVFAAPVPGIPAGFRISAHRPIEKPRSILLRFFFLRNWRRKEWPFMA